MGYALWRSVTPVNVLVPDMSYFAIIISIEFSFKKWEVEREKTLVLAALRYLQCPSGALWYHNIFFFFQYIFSHNLGTVDGSKTVAMWKTL